MDPAFFGLPDPNDPNLQDWADQRQIGQLQELRFLAKSQELTYTEARTLHPAIRRWWIDQINSDQAALAEASRSKKPNSS